MQRIQTGIPNLDGILHGGFPAASINIVAGGPGTGKTMLTQQMIYRNATPERKALYLTTVSEPMHKILRYVQGFPFFDPGKVGEAVQYEDIGEMLQKSGVDEVMQRVEEMVIREGPAFLVIDSFKALSDLAEDVASFRRALYKLTGVLTATGCTTLLLGEYTTEEVKELPEFAVVDGIVELTNERTGIRTTRYLSVVKLRGSGYADGKHAIRLTGEGFSIFPRFVTPDSPEQYEVTGEKSSIGVPRLDGLIGGGVLEGSNTLVVGPTGTGKTLLGLSLALEGVRRGRRAVFVSFQEDPSHLRWLAGNFGWDPAESVSEEMLELLYVSPVELDLDEHIIRIVDAIRRVDADYVVIDSVTDLEAGAYDEARFTNYMYSLVQYLKDNRITSLMTYENNQTFEGSTITANGVSRIADNVIVLSNSRHGRRVERELQVLKTRGTPHDQDIHAFDIREGEGFHFLDGGGRRREEAAKPPA